MRQLEHPQGSPPRTMFAPGYSGRRRDRQAQVFDPPCRLYQFVKSCLFRLLAAQNVHAMERANCSERLDRRLLS